MVKKSDRVTKPVHTKSQIKSTIRQYNEAVEKLKNADPATRVGAHEMAVYGNGLYQTISMLEAAYRERIIGEMPVEEIIRDLQELINQEDNNES